MKSPVFMKSISLVKQTMCMVYDRTFSYQNLSELRRYFIVEIHPRASTLSVETNCIVAKILLKCHVLCNFSIFYYKLY